MAEERQHIDGLIRQWLHFIDENPECASGLADYTAWLLARIPEGDQ